MAAARRAAAGARATGGCCAGKKKLAVRYASLAMVKEAMGAGQRLRRHVPPVLFLLALALLIVAIARPQARGHAAVAARDDHPGDGRVGQHARRRRRAQPPRRRAGGGQAPSSTTCRAHARSAWCRSPAPRRSCRRRRSNREDIIAAIDRFQLQRGTAIGSGIVVSLETIFPDAEFDLRSWNPRVDQGKSGAARPGAAARREGAAQAGAARARTPRRRSSCSPTASARPAPIPIEAAKMAAERGVRVFTVGIGTEEGEMIGFEGWSMRVRLDEETLKKIANITQGEYFYAGTATDLKKVYEIAQLEARGREAADRDHRAVRGGGALFAVLAAVLSMLWFGRIM